MANTLLMTKTQIYDAAYNAAKKAYPEIEIPEFTIETPKDKGHGDYAVNIAMLLARSAKSAPRAIAEKIVENISAEDLSAEKIEIAGPGNAGAPPITATSWYGRAGWKRSGRKPAL